MTQSTSVVVRKFGDADTLELKEGTLGALKSGFARIKVAAIGVGYTDVMARRGEYIWQRRAPFTPGYELSGTVEEYAPSGNVAPSWLVRGVRVAAVLPKMAAYTSALDIPIELLAPLPDGVSHEAAAAMGLNYLTALSMLERHAKLKSGDTILIQGAAGGVGSALCQLGKHRGLVMFGTASQSDFERLQAQGVTPIDYKQDDYEVYIKKHVPSGVDAVFDHLGGRHLRKARRILAVHGTLVSYAFVGKPGHVLRDTIFGAAYNRLLGLLPGRRTSLCAVPGEIRKDPLWASQSLERLLQLLADGKLDIGPIVTIPLTSVKQAHKVLENHTNKGKIVLYPSRESKFSKRHQMD